MRPQWNNLVAIALLVGAGILPALASAADNPALTLHAARPANGSGFDRLYRVEGMPATTPHDRLAVPDDTLPGSQLREGERVTLRIFHFNDLHSKHVVPHAKRGSTHNFAQMVKRVGDARRNAPSDEGVLFLSAGDDHIGEVYDELLGSDVGSFIMSLPYRAYSAAGLDAAVLGNHEFDKGPAILARMIEADARFPVLSANLSGAPMLADRVAPAVMGITKGMRVAIVGLTTPEETKTGFADAPGMTLTSPVTTLRNLAPALVPHTDLLIVLSHVGFNGAQTGSARHSMREGDVELARYLATLGIPALVIGGHTHSTLNIEGLQAENVIDGVPVLQAGSWGSHLGEVAVELERTADRTTLKMVEARLHALKRRDQRVAADDPKFASLEQDGDIDQAFQRDVIAPMTARLDERLAIRLASTDGNTDAGAEATTADRYTGESAIANFMNDAVLARSETFPGGAVDLVAFNASAIITGIPQDAPLLFKDWYAVMPYADIVRIVEMSGQQIHDLVQSNAKRLVRPGEQVDLAGFVSRGFLHFSGGLRYTVRLGSDATKAHAEEITLLGKPIESVLDQRYRVAFGDYIASGNEGWRGAPILAGLPDEIIGFDLRALDNKDTGLVYRNEIIEFIREKGTVSTLTGARKDGRVTVMP